MKTITLPAVFFLGGLLIISMIPIYITKNNPNDVNLSHSLLQPSLSFVFGTDDLGRDILTRVIYGARISLFAAFGAQVISFVIGIILGIIAGYYKYRWQDKLLSFVMSCFYGFPFLLFVLAITAALGPGIYKVMFAIGIVNWVGIARITRGEVISHSEREYVMAAKAFGFSNIKVMFYHILPNVIPASLVVIILGFGDVVAVEAGLSFLGLGVQPPTPSWGKMIFIGKDYITTAWWMSIFPGLFLVMTILAFNVIGEALEERWKSR